MYINEAILELDDEKNKLSQKNLLESCGFAVNGTDTTCVVAMNGKMSIRPSDRYPLSTRDVLSTALAYIGVWANTTTEFCQEMTDQGTREGPLGVVSVTPDAALEDHYLRISRKVLTSKY